MILIYEGRDISGIMDEEDWEVLDPDGDEANDKLILHVRNPDIVGEVPSGCFKGLC